MEYLNTKDVLVIHARLIDRTGGSHGVRDLGLLESAISACRQSFGEKEVYQGVWDKSAALFEKIASNHPFVDGNKRTAITATSRFLYLNGYEITVSQQEMVSFTLRVAKNEVDIQEIADWLKEKSEKRAD